MGHERHHSGGAVAHSNGCRLRLRRHNHQLAGLDHALGASDEMSESSGYSGTPLAKKLGIKDDFRVKTKRAPADYVSLLDSLPQGVRISSRLRGPVDLWHYFTKSRRELESQLGVCLKEIRQDGMIWISWPKKASGVATDVTEDIVREVAVPMGLVDVKVCAVDAVWSGLKLVIRKENRR